MKDVCRHDIDDEIHVVLYCTKRSYGYTKLHNVRPIYAIEILGTVANRRVQVNSYTSVLTKKFAAKSTVCGDNKAM